MELIDYLRILRRRWLSIVLIGVVICALTTVYAVLQPKQYKSTIRLFASSAAGDGTPALTGVLAAQQSVVSFADFVNSDKLAEQVLHATNAPLTVAKLQQEIKVSYGGASLTIMVTDADPHRAQQLARAYGDGVEKIVQELAGAPSASHLPINLTVYDPASFSDKPVSMSPLLEGALALVIGLIIGMGVAAFRETMAQQRQRTATSTHD